MTPQELWGDPTTPYWAKRVISVALELDPVDAANTLEVIAQCFRERSDRLLEELCPPPSRL